MDSDTEPNPAFSKSEKGFSNEKHEELTFPVVKTEPELHMDANKEDPYSCSDTQQMSLSIDNNWEEHHVDIKHEEHPVPGTLHMIKEERFDDNDDMKKEIDPLCNMCNSHCDLRCGLVKQEVKQGRKSSNNVLKRISPDQLNSLLHSVSHSYVCTVCGESFNRKSQLAHHSRMATVLHANLN